MYDEYYDYFFGSIFGKSSDASNYECTAYYSNANDVVFTYASGVVPLHDDSLLTWSGSSPTSIITLTERSHTVAVVGLLDGNLLKGTRHKRCYY